MGWREERGTMMEEGRGEDKILEIGTKNVIPSVNTD